MKKTSLVLTALCLLPAAFLLADVRMPGIFSNRMVLEKSSRVPVWGKADPGEEVTVTLDGQTVKATAGADGKWNTALDLSKSGPGPFVMTVRGKNAIEISDVVVGEVWIASGQSNMEWAFKNTIGAEEESARSENPLLRTFQVKKATSRVPLDECEGEWISASPATAHGFSAVGYYFGKALQNELGVPVGIVSTYWGGTPSEAWTSVPALETVPELKTATETLFKRIDEQPAAQKAWVEKFGAWLKETGREDKPAGEAAAFAAPDASLEGWETVSIPGTLTGKSFTGDGAVWMRAEIDRTEPVTGPLGLELGPIEGFESVYWNGELLTALDWKDYPGTGYNRRWGKYSVPQNKVLKGKNTLALRLYAPAGPAKIPAAIKVGGKAPGAWLAKSEYPLPPLTADQMAAVPQPPVNPPAPQYVSGHLYNGMINPIVPYAISGVIWYQGESNAGRATQYRTAFPLMIKDWRAAWKQGDFPFYFCQLANFMEKTPTPGESGWAELREAQSMTLSLPATGQAVLIDVGESADIHPRNKKDVGLRLSKIALAQEYGKDIPFSGPVFKDLKIEGDKARISFTHTNGGLAARPVPATYDVVTRENKTAPTVRNSPNSELEGFAICGEDKKWVWADAKIDGDTVVVWADSVKNPVAVRYGWANNPTVNLYNGAGLPASPFRTDDFPETTRGGKYGK